MSLTIVTTQTERLVGPEVEVCLHEQLASRGHATLLVPSFDQALSAQQALAETDKLDLGVQVDTPQSWAEERWGVWGDGRFVVSQEERRLLIRAVLKKKNVLQGASDHIEGTVELLVQLAREGLPAFVGTSNPRGVVPAEASTVALLATYAHMLAEHSRIEASELMTILPEVLATDSGDKDTLVCAGFTELSYGERELFCRLAQTGEVVFVAHLGDGPAYAAVRTLIADLKQWAAALNVSVEERVSELRSPAPERHDELTQLLQRLYQPGDVPLCPTGAVRGLLAAGPSAEPALVTHEMVSLVGEGLHEIVLATPDPLGAWNAIAPRMQTAGLAVQARFSQPFMQTEAGRAFIEFATGVAHLAALAKTWPATEELPDTTTKHVHLADMSWWPPRDLSDYLMSCISQVSEDQAWRIDTRWRANRLLTPQAVLDTLLSEKDTSRETAAATRELLRGRLGSAASKLLAPFVTGALNQSPHAPEVSAVLTSVLSVARSLKAWQDVLLDHACADEFSASDLVVLVEDALQVLQYVRIPLRLAFTNEKAAAVVRIMRPEEAARLAPASVDALVLLGQTSTEQPVTTPENEQTELAKLYGVDVSSNTLDGARARFASLIAVPRSTFVWERKLFSADGRECYPSVLLGELLACYGVETSAQPEELMQVFGAENIQVRSEISLAENAYKTGKQPSVVATEHVAPAGQLEAEERLCVSPPPEGSTESTPVLSASQIETYLECPYKWFSLRRLRLRDSDAGFTGAEIGTFAHRVLEVTHRELLARAVEQARGEKSLDQLAEAAFFDADIAHRDNYTELVSALIEQAQTNPELRFPGSALSDEETVEQAQTILSRVFTAHLDHQYLLERGRHPLRQALVAHTAEEQGRVEALRRDLTSLLKYEAGLFEGFEPRYFEWRFGRGENEVSYAGVRIIGTVDRIDIDCHGQAMVIDYKHKAPNRFNAEHDVFSLGAQEIFTLPRRVQALMYAQVIRRAFPDLKVRGALYLCTKGTHALAGAVDENLIERVFGDNQLSRSRTEHVAVPRANSFGQMDTCGFEALLDACEEAIAAKIERLLAGDIEATPLDAAACQFCPVLNCERRLS